MPRHPYDYLCPACYIHRQEYKAPTKNDLKAHLMYSHKQEDLARTLVRQVTGLGQ